MNNTYGHQQGDLVLRRVAEVLRDTYREADSAARYGGEELAMIMRHTGLAGAHEPRRTSADRDRAARGPRVDPRGWLKITTSVGVASVTGGRKDELVAAADGALYAAKRSGKNRTVCADGVADEDGAARELARSTSAPRSE